MSKLGKLDKKIWFIVSGIIVLITVAVFMLSKDKVLILKENHIVVEYGQQINDNPSEYLKLKDKSLVSKIKIDNNFKMEENKNYLKIGKYKMSFSYKKEKVTLDIEVKDTTKPTFNTCDSIEFIKGTEFDYPKYIKASDLQGVTCNYDYSLVNINVPGEYTVKVTAYDESNNKVEKEVKVKVLDIDITQNDVETVVDDKGNVTVKVTPKPKEEKPQTPSSNTSSNTNGGSSPSTNQSPNNSTSNSTPTPPKTETPHQHYSSFISPLFDSVEEYRKWAEDYLDSDENFYNTKYSGYVGERCSCKKYGVTSFY